MGANNKINQAYIYILIAIILWGISFLWTNKLIQLGIPITTFIFFRMLFAGIILFIISTATKTLQRIKLKDYKYLLIMVFFEPFIYFLGESYGMKATNSPTVTSVIIGTIPVFVMISDLLFYKVKLSGWNKFGVLVTLPGIILMAMSKGDFSVEYWWGILFLIVAIIGSVGYSIIVKKLTDNYNTQTITTYQFCIGSLFFLPLFISQDLSTFNPSTFFTLEVLYPLLSLAIFCSAIAFFLYIESIKYLGMTRACIFTAVIPAISAFGAFIIGQEKFTPIQIFGIIIVITGIILTQKKSNNKIQNHEKN